VPSSMTGFGQASFSDHEVSADIIVRSVNGKHLKTKVHVGVGMPSVAERIAAMVAKCMTRGTVDVAVRLDWAGAGGTAFNERIIASYVRQLERLRKKLGLSAETRIDEVALLPGAMVSDGPSGRAENRIWRKLKPVVAAALESAARMRESEGRMLAASLRRNCSRITRLLARIESRAATGVAQYRRRLARRVRALLDEAGAALDPGSFAREIIMYAQRSDISEELCRMRAHVDHFVKALKGDGAGRKLEFIAQEMHREANTMASKAADPVTTERIIDLRGEVDKIREQVVNLE